MKNRSASILGIALLVGLVFDCDRPDVYPDVYVAGVESVNDKRVACY
jgi:hypothetical protein